MRMTINKKLRVMAELYRATVGLITPQCRAIYLHIVDAQSAVVYFTITTQDDYENEVIQEIMTEFEIEVEDSMDIKHEVVVDSESALSELRFPGIPIYLRHETPID